MYEHRLFKPEDIPSELRQYFDEVEVECGAPWERVTERIQFGKAHSDTKFNKTMQGGPLSGSRQAYRAMGLEGPPAPITTGWHPTCTCTQEGTGRCIALDPFMGAGTTAMVAIQHGRDWLGVELNPTYIDLAMKRIAYVQQHLWTGIDELTIEEVAG